MYQEIITITLDLSQTESAPTVHAKAQPFTLFPSASCTCLLQPAPTCTLNCWPWHFYDFHSLTLFKLYSYNCPDDWCKGTLAINMLSNVFICYFSYNRCSMYVMCLCIFLYLLLPLRFSSFPLFCPLSVYLCLLCCCPPPALLQLPHWCVLLCAIWIGACCVSHLPHLGVSGLREDTTNEG